MKTKTFTGNTPTLMGKTIYGYWNNVHQWKHPHAHGEDRDDIPATFSALETPPRSWGRQPLNLKSLTQLRNTPTLMGKTMIPTTHQ